MNVEEIQKARAQFAAAVTKLVQEFEAATGCRCAPLIVQRENVDRAATGVDFELRLP